MIHEVRVMGRYEFKRTTLSKNTAFIRISDPDLYEIPISQMDERGLFLQFVDLMPAEVKNGFSIFKDVIFTKEQACRIIEFLASLPKEMEILICSCEMGMSRSPAVANFAIDFLNISHAKFLPPVYGPNPYVTKLLNLQRKKLK